MSPCTLDRAVALADATRYIIRLTPGSYTGNEAITKQISIEGTGSTLAAATVNGTALDLRNGAVLAVIGLTINAPTASTGGVLCSGGTLVLSHVTIDSAVSGLAANPPSGSCTVTVEQSVVKTQSTSQPAIITTTNTVLNIDRSLIDGGDGIQSFASSAQIQIKNTIFRNQSATDGAFVGLGHFTVDFSTFVDAPLKCVSNSSVTISDSVLWAAGQNAVIGTGVGCIVSSSLVDVDPLFQDAANGNFSLKAGSPAIDAAPANATVPPVDFVGTTRPQGPRADLGAYEYKP